MPLPPPQPKIYHITHVDNLSSIVSNGGLLSDARLVAGAGSAAAIGMSKIKTRRLRLPVPCHPGDCVGDYVPFYLCPRSIMLYVIHCANHPELTYRGGQEPIVHLVAEMHEVIAWANANSRRWAFSLSNAGAYLAEFRANEAHLDEIDWQAVAATDFRSASVREGKQAEFLVHGDFPWHLVSQIGVCDDSTRVKAEAALSAAAHRPVVDVTPQWYY